MGGRRLAKVVANRFSESHEFIHLHLRPHVDWVDGKMGLWLFFFIIIICLFAFLKYTPVCQAIPIFIIFLVFPTFDAKDSFSKFYF